jgi:D-alanine-D-alanine ligase
MKRVLLLLGGESPERDVSYSTGQACARSLAQLGYDLWLLDPAQEREPCGIDEFPFGDGPVKQAPRGAAVEENLLPRLLRTLDSHKPDLVFNCLHGGFGEDGRLAAVLDLAGIPQTASGFRGSAIAMDKYQSKLQMKALGIPTPACFCLQLHPQPHEQTAFETWLTEQTWPLIVKPNCMGSSVGIKLVDERPALDAAIAEVRRLGDQILVEEFIGGRELTVGQIGEQLLPVVEILPKEGWYDYRNKYSGGTDYECPAKIETSLQKDLHAWTSALSASLSLSGATRSDYRLSPDGRAYCLEVNTTPGMTTLSLVPMAALSAGLSFTDLVAEICRLAFAD